MNNKVIYGWGTTQHKANESLLQNILRLQKKWACSFTRGPMVYMRNVTDHAGKEWPWNVSMKVEDTREG